MAFAACVVFVLSKEAKNSQHSNFTLSLRISLRIHHHGCGLVRIYQWLRKPEWRLQHVPVNPHA